MAEAKPFASLSSGLLARKGAARPAMRPQGFGQGGGSLEDLGWNDMGFEPPKAAEAPRDPSHDAFGESVVEHPRAHPTGLTPVQSPVHHQQAELAEHFQPAGDEDEADETAEFYDAAEEAAPLDEPAEPEEPMAFEPVDEPAEPEEPMAFEPVDEPVEPAPVAILPAMAEPSKTPAAAAPRRASRTRSAPGKGPKAAFTLRLDRDRHLKLRLACAVDGRSAQQLVTDALDRMLESMPELETLAAKAARKE